MFSKKHPFIGAAALALPLALALTSCAGTTAPVVDPNGGPGGDPVAGGVLNLLITEEPRNLDPAAMNNNALGMAAVGNALYGTLLYDVGANEFEFGLAESLESTDNGKTFTLTLRPDLEFTDGEPLDAEAVKYNWDRLKDEELASSSRLDAIQIDSSEVIDEVTLEFTMKAPSPIFAAQIAATAMNWIASPAALEGGNEAFDENPVGAGPFVLTNWTRGGTMELEKNVDYFDAPRPYLDGLVIGTAGDETQALNSIVAGEYSLAPATKWPTRADAETEGLQIVAQDMAGGLFLGMRTDKAPFDDIRARQAVSFALDVEALNLVVNEGFAPTADTMFPEGSPYYNDVQLHTYDPEKAQELFDELAAEGKPVSFAITIFNADAYPEAVQAQLAAYENVTVEIVKRDAAETGKVYNSGDFNMVRTALNFREPEPYIYRTFFSESPRNSTVTNDPELDEALLDGRNAETIEERQAAFEVASERLAEISTAIFLNRSSQAAIAANNVGGLTLYGTGSTLVDRLWLAPVAE